MAEQKDYYTPKPTGNQREKIAILTADKNHDLEFFYPLYRFAEAGYQVDVLTPRGGEVKGKFGMSLPGTKAVTSASAQDYALLYIPGGQAPEALKKEEAAVAFVREFCKTGNPVAAICHGAQVLAAAGVINGKKISAWPEVEGEVKAAGGVYVNSETLEDGQFITARWPADLPAHLSATLGRLQGSQQRRSAA